MAQKKTTVDVRCGRLFPFPFLLIGGALFLAGLGILLARPIVGVILLLLGLLILTAYQGTEISPSYKTYREYNSFLFLKSGRKKKYEDIEKLFINSGKVSQTMYTAHTMNSSTFSHTEYNAYLKFSNGIKIFLVSDKSKDKLLRKMSDIARALNTQIIDNTVGIVS